MYFGIMWMIPHSVLSLVDEPSYLDGFHLAHHLSLPSYGQVGSAQLPVIHGIGMQSQGIVV